MKFLRWSKNMVIVVVVLVAAGAGGLWVLSASLTPTPLREASAPDPAEFSDAVIQVYGADVWGIRGRFAIHTWVATKARDADTYNIYQVIGWQLRRSGNAVVISKGNPDRPWFRSPPILLHELTGAAAQALIDRVHNAALSYPYAREYTMWPGPNSNSFTAWISLEVPELGLDLPAKALGASWMEDEYPQIRLSDTTAAGR